MSLKEVLRTIFVPKEPKIKIPKAPREQTWGIKRDMPRMPRDGKR